jgi:hypothetical protein
LPKSTFIDWSASGSRPGLFGSVEQAWAGVPETPLLVAESAAEVAVPEDTVSGTGAIRGALGAASTWLSGTTARTLGSCCKRLTSALDIVAATAFTNE